MEKREQKRKEKEAKEKEIEKLKTTQPEKYLNDLMLERKELKTKIKQINLYKEDANLRKTRDNKLIQNFDNYLNQDQDNQTNNEFDYVMKEFMDISSDCEKYEHQLSILNQRIKEVEPNFDEEFDNDDLIITNRYSSHDGIYIGTDIVRATESLFRPYLIGNSQKGLFECIRDVLKGYNDEKIKELLKNVYLVGGGASIKGMKERIRNDLFLHFSSRGIDEVNVITPDDPIDTPYEGIKLFYDNYAEKYREKLFYTKKEYDEFGSNLFKNCPIGNY